MLKKYPFAVSLSLLAGLQLSSGWAENQEEVRPPIKSPFFANKVEIEPGGILMLRPRIPYVDGLASEDYNLVLSLPSWMKPNPLQVCATDQQDKVDSISETAKNVKIDGMDRIEFSYKPDISQALGGMELQFSYQYKDNSNSLYASVMKFSGSFDWKLFKREIQLSEDHVHLVPLLLKWGDNPIQSGTLHFKRLQIKEAGSGETVFDCHPKEPVVMKLSKGQNTCWLSEDPAKIGANTGGDRVKLKPGGKYIVECLVKGEDIKGQNAISIKDALTKKISYTRTLFFGIDKKISLPDKLLWRMEGKDGKVYGNGTISLIQAKERIAPKVMDASTWICETWLQNEPLAIQKLYVGKLHSWGLNAIEPKMPEPVYGNPLTDEALSMPVAKEAKRLGMRVRAYLRFLYEKTSAEGYLNANPQFAAITPEGKRSSRAPVCPTHYLEKGNPWLKYHLDAIRRSVEVNGLDGVFFDFEINAAPYMKYRPGNIAFPAGAPKKWRLLCMCERCRKAFQSSIGLEHAPSVEECSGDSLYEKWIDFRCRQNIELWKMVAQAVKSCNPNTTFAIYSGPAGNYSRQAYGVDWTMDAPYLDFAMQRDYCPFRKKLADEFYATLVKGMPNGKTPPKMFFQLMAFPYSDTWMYGGDPERFYDELQNMKNHVVRTVAVCHSFGWSFTGIWGMDDQLTLPIKEANSILAKHEDYFVKGEKVENLVNAASGDVEIATWRNGDRKATFVFNMKAQPQDVVLKLEGMKQPAEAKLKVEAHDCYVYEWTAASAP